MATAPQHVLILTVQRSGSDLLQKLLSQQPDMALNADPNPEIFEKETGTNRYLFNLVTDPDISKMRFYPGRDNYTENELDLLKERAYKPCLDRLNNDMVKAEKEGKSTWHKEHSHWLIDPIVGLDFARKFGKIDLDTNRKSSVSMPDGQKKTNISIFSDDYLLSNFRAVIVIRHPALSMASQYRRDTLLPKKYNSDDEYFTFLKTRSSMFFQKSIFDFYKRNGREVIVIDSDDIMNTESGVVKQLCEMTGLDYSKVLSTWEPKSEKFRAELDDDFQRRMTRTIELSNGIIPGLDYNSVMTGGEKRRWREEFGADRAARLEQTIEESLEPYEYLKQFKILPVNSK